MSDIELRTIDINGLPAAARQADPGRQLSVVEYAMRQGATAADVRALVELQIQMDNHKLAMLKQQDEREREERTRLSVLSFRSDFAAFRGENIVVPLTKDVDRGRAGSFVQAEYHVASSMLSAALSRHGFSVRHKIGFGSKPWTTDGAVSDVPWVYVTCYLEHRDGYAETLDLEGPPGDLSANTPTQNMQVTASYLKRQSLLAITGTATGGEDDENRLRGRGSRHPGGAAKQGQIAGDDDPLVIDGERCAQGGAKDLNEWWGRQTESDRKRLTPKFAGMRKAARLVDTGGVA